MEKVIPTIEKCKKCENYINWEYSFDLEQPDVPCESCRPQGQSHNIDFKNCPLLISKQEV